MSVRKSKDGYLIDFTIDGKRYRESIPAPHNKAAQKRIEEQESYYKMAITLKDETLVSRFKNSAIVLKAFAAEGTKKTIHEYSNIWFSRHQRNWSHTTIRGYSQKYNFYIRPYFGGCKLSEFRSSMFLDWTKTQTLAGKTLNEIRSILILIFKEAFHDNMIEENTAKRIPRFKQNHSEPKPFNDNEIDKILKNLSSPFRQYFQLAFNTGLRTGELIALRWEDIDMERKLAHIRRSISNGVEKEPKTKGSIRTIELNDEALEALKFLENSEHTNLHRVFINPTTGKCYPNADGIRKYVWQPALIKAGVPYRYPYQCRHTFASKMLSAGKNPMWVASQLGHSDWGMIRKTYGRWIKN